MGHPFEELPTTPTADEVVDQAFSRAARAGRAKSGLEAQRSMLQTATNVASDNLEHVVTSWPDLTTLSPFYAVLADAMLADVLDASPVEPAEVDGDGGDGDASGGSGAPADPAPAALGGPTHASEWPPTGDAAPDERPVETDPRGGVDALRQHLAAIGWAAGEVESLKSEYQGRLRGDTDTARDLRKQAFARVADVIESVADDLEAVGAARDALRNLPDVRPDEPTVVVAGAPNVGKSSFVNAVTAATNETATYPFTTTDVQLGHVEVDRIRYQLVDTPGLLDRPPGERNDVEARAITALTHLADAVLVVVDPTGTSGYPLSTQRALLSDVRDRFDVPVVVVANKADLEGFAAVVDVLGAGADAADRAGESGDVISVDLAMSVTEDENVEDVLQAAVDAVDYEPELPFEE